MLKHLAWLLFSSGALAQQVTVNLTSNKDNAVFQAVVYLEPTSPDARFPVPEEVSVMDQIERQFVPHILPIQQGSKVVFPNSDSIKHHVYSFSPAKRFELKLYKGSKQQPLTFKTQGEVELGCNVHDWMLAYIWVVDTPYFAKTNQSGTVTLDVPEGEYTVRVWHPRIQDDFDRLTQTINVNSDMQVEIKLQQDLLTDLSLFEEDSDGFSDYE